MSCILLKNTGKLPKNLEIPFAMEVFNMLTREGKINNVIIIIDNMNCQHSWFNIYCGQSVSPFDDKTNRNIL
jgi:hypothetical protein